MAEQELATAGLKERPLQSEDFLFFHPSPFSKWANTGSEL